MPLFDELMEYKKLEDPAERKVEELERSKKKYKRGKFARKTSVSSTQYNVTMRIIVTILALGIMAAAGYAIYLGVMEFIPAG